MRHCPLGVRLKNCILWKENAALIQNYESVCPKIARSAYVHERATLIGDVTLGEEASVWPGAVLRGDIAPIVVGARTSVQDGCLLHTSHDMPLTLGNDVTLGHGAVLHSCTVGNFSLIGMGAIVLDGAVVEGDAIVGAGSLVPPGMRVPSGKVVMGTPAKVVRDLRPEEREMIRRGVAEYLHLMQSYAE